MSDNPYYDFKFDYLSNLPQGVTWDAATASYGYNGKRFKNIWSVEWYRGYLFATEGFVAGGGITPVGVEFVSFTDMQNQTKDVSLPVGDLILIADVIKGDAAVTFSGITLDGVTPTTILAGTGPYNATLAAYRFNNTVDELKTVVFDLSDSFDYGLTVYKMTNAGTATAYGNDLPQTSGENDVIIFQSQTINKAAGAIPVQSNALTQDVFTDLRTNERVYAGSLAGATTLENTDPPFTETDVGSSGTGYITIIVEPV